MIKLLRNLVALWPLVFFGAALLYDLNPGGQLQASYDLQSDVPLISRLFPANRLAGASTDGQRVLQEPVYFDLRSPQPYQKARLTISYDNQGQSLLQLGLKMAGEDDWSYQLKPLENSTLDSLDWPKVTAGQLTLWQRLNKFQSVNDFLANYYDLDVAAYNFDLLKPYLQTGYQGSNKRQQIDRLIRGNYSILTYVKNETLDWQFKFVDFNRTEGSDEFQVTVSDWQRQPIWQETVSDDGVADNFSGISSERTVKINLTDLPEGVYRLEWAAASDIFTTQVETSQHLIAFEDQLYLANNQEYQDGLPALDTSPTTVYSNAGTLGFFTAHPLGLQTVTVDGQPLVIEKIKEQFFITGQDGLSQIQTPLNDVLIRGDGLFYFDRSHVFNPEVIKLKNFDPTTNVDYVIADYRSPELRTDGSKTATVDFDLDGADIKSGSLRFILSAPNLQDQGNLLTVKKIEATLYKPPFDSWQQALTLIINKFFHVL